MSAINEKQSQNNVINLNQLITIEDLLNFKDELLYEIAKLLKTEMPSTSKQWLKSSEVRKLLNLSPGTLQTLRINKTLPYQKVGGVMYYKWSDIEKMMDKDNTDTKSG